MSLQKMKKWLIQPQVSPKDPVISQNVFVGLLAYLVLLGSQVSW